MLVALELAGRNELVGEPAGLLRGRPAPLRLEREGVLVLARDVPALGDVLAGLPHRLEREHRLEPRVREAPAEHGVVERPVAARPRRRRASPSRAARASSTRRRPRRRGRRRRPRSRGTRRRPPRAPRRRAGSPSRPRPSRAAPRAAHAIRATFRLSSPAWFAQPNQTSSISPASTPARSTAAAIATAARSSGRTPESPPPYRPTGVRTAEITTARVIRLLFVEHALGDREGRVRGGDAAVDRALQQHLLRSRPSVRPLRSAARTCSSSSSSRPSATRAVSVIALRIRRSRPGRDQISPQA